MKYIMGFTLFPLGPLTLEEADYHALRTFKQLIWRSSCKEEQKTPANKQNLLSKYVTGPVLVDPLPSVSLSDADRLDQRLQTCEQP